MMSMNNFIGFYHEYDGFGCFSNWYHAEFDYAGVHFKNSEQFMMYHKVLMFWQDDLAEKILASDDPGECKNLARQKFPEFVPEVWDKTCYQIVKRGVRAKFIQNPDILKTLLGTGNALLAECSPRDTKWGIGLDISDPAINDISKWRGHNLLGRILMEVRDELNQEQASLGRLEFVDAARLKAIPEWDMKPGELKRIPQFYKAIHAYSDTLGLSGIDDSFFFNKCVFSAIEHSMYYNMGGGFPIFGFFEMKQDIYDTARRLGG